MIINTDDFDSVTQQELSLILNEQEDIKRDIRSKLFSMTKEQLLKDVDNKIKQESICGFHSNYWNKYKVILSSY